MSVPPIKVDDVELKFIPYTEENSSENSSENTSDNAVAGSTYIGNYVSKFYRTRKEMDAAKKIVKDEYKLDDTKVHTYHTQGGYFFLIGYSSIINPDTQNTGGGKRRKSKRKSSKKSKRRKSSKRKRSKRKSRRRR